MNYADLQTEILQLLIDTPTAVQQLVPAWVNRAIRKIEQKHDFKDMEKTATFTTATGVLTLGARPSDWKKARSKPWYTDDSGYASELEMFYTSRAEAGAMWGSNPIDTGSPQALVEQDGNFQVWPLPDGLSQGTSGQYIVNVPYYAYLSDLTTSSDTNWFTENASQYIINYGVTWGFYANEDENRALIWEKLTQREEKDVILADKRRRLSNTDVLVPHTGARRPHTQG